MAKKITVELNLDFKLLRKQKEELLKACASVPILEGIVHMLDSIQDQAVDKFGIPEKTVFGELKDE